MNQATVDRFWSKVKKTESCWLWTASKRNKGYGAFVWANSDGEVIQGRAHRFSWELHVGPIPQGKCVLHNCPGGDNPACVNPAHLFVGTKADNNADMCAKGRHISGGTHVRPEDAKYKRGIEHHAARLAPLIIRAMRRDHANGYSFSELQKKYNTTIGHAWRIVHRKAWKHVK